MLNHTLGLKTNVPSAFSIKDVAGLRVWLPNGAGITLNGGLVSAWADNSGNGNNATQSTETNQPLSSGGGIDLDGTDNFMTLTSVENLTTFTIFAVIDGMVVDKDNRNILSVGDIIKTGTFKKLSKCFKIKKNIILLSVNK